MGLDPQSCSYPPPNRPCSSRKDDEAAVDRLVYELYGLTEEEIAIVEGTAK